MRLDKPRANTPTLKLNRLCCKSVEQLPEDEAEPVKWPAGFHQSRVTDHQSPLFSDGLGKFYGQAERAISTGQLRALLHFHLPPIKVVVFDRSS